MSFITSLRYSLVSNSFLIWARISCASTLVAEKIAMVISGLQKISWIVPAVVMIVVLPCTRAQIGRASCRERVENWEGAGDWDRRVGTNKRARAQTY